MRSLRVYFRRWQQRPKVRPWAVAGPALILLIALPLLRPLRHPAEIADDEWLRLRTVQALVEHRTLAIARVRTDAAPAAATSGSYVAPITTHDGADEPVM